MTEYLCHVLDDGHLAVEMICNAFLRLMVRGVILRPSFNDVPDTTSQWSNIHLSQLTTKNIIYVKVFMKTLDLVDS